MKLTIVLSLFWLAALIIVPVQTTAQNQSHSQSMAQPKGKRAFKDAFSNGATKVERELIRAENEQIEAVSNHDADTLRRVLADEFTFVGSSSTGERTHKDRYIENAFRYTWISYSFSDFFIRVYDRTAVVNCRLTRQAALEGHDINGDYLFTDVWVKRAARWQLVARHSTQIHGS